MKAVLPDKSVDADFLCHVLASSQPALASLIDESGHGTRRFPTERWREMTFGFPSLSEQRAVCDWINRASAQQNRAIDGAEREIALIQELRTRLIADVVTGQLDIRKVAASLPEKVDGPELLEAEDEVDEFEDSESEAFAPEEAAA